MNDPEFTSLIDHATRDLHPDVDRLLAGGAARGRASLRRRRVGTTLTAAAVAGLVTVAALTVPSLLADEPAPVAQSSIVAAGGPSGAPVPDAQPDTPDRPITVPAREIPALVAEQLGGEAGPIIEDAKYPLVNSSDRRIVHFRWKGTLTSVIIEPANRLAGCEELATADPVPGKKMRNQSGIVPTEREFNDCQVADGLKVMIAPAPDLPQKAHSVSAWNHGYLITAVSYNTALGKNPDGSEDVPLVMEQPAIGFDDLQSLVTSEIWFD